MNEAENKPAVIPEQRQMCWKFFNNDRTKNRVLHLRLRAGDPFLPYINFPMFAKRDYEIPGGSKGWATYQSLRQAGWELISDPD